MIEPTNEDGLWTADQVAAYLHASRSWVYQRAASGELPCVKIIGLLRFEPETIRAFARGERVAGTQRAVAGPPR